MYLHLAVVSRPRSQASGAGFDISDEIVSTVEGAIGARTLHHVKLRFAPSIVLVPACPFNMQRPIPGVHGSVAQPAAIDHGWNILPVAMRPQFFAELCRELAYLVEKHVPVALLVVEVLILRQAAAKLRVEARGRCHLGRGEKSARRPVLSVLVSTPFFRGFNSARQRE